MLPGTDHVMLGGYGVVQADGTVSAPYPSADGATDLRRWIDGWATGVGSAPRGEGQRRGPQRPA